METSCRRVAGKVFQNVGPEIFYHFPGVCSYLLNVGANMHFDFLVYGKR